MSVTQWTHTCHADATRMLNLHQFIQFIDEKFTAEKLVSANFTVRIETHA